jgi:hypothetical protein
LGRDNSARFPKSCHDKRVFPTIDALDLLPRLVGEFFVTRTYVTNIWCVDADWAAAPAHDQERHSLSRLMMSETTLKTPFDTHPVQAIEIGGKVFSFPEIELRRNMGNPFECFLQLSSRSPTFDEDAMDNA